MRESDLFDGDLDIQVTLPGAIGYTGALPSPAPDDCLANLSHAFGRNLPDDYLQLMRRMNGFAGVVGPTPSVGRWIHIFACQTALLEQSDELAATEPHLMKLGSDGAEAAFLLDRRDSTWVELPYMDFGSPPPYRLERRFSSFAQMLAEISANPFGPATTTR